MNHHPDPTPHHNDPTPLPTGDLDPTAAALRNALHHQAQHITPSPDGLQRIQRQLQTTPRRAPFLTRLTPALTAAAAVAVLAVAGTVAVRLNQQPTTDPATRPTASTTADRPTTRSQVPVYVIGAQGGHQWLFREYRNTFASGTDDRVADAVTDAVNLRPLNQEYRDPLFQGSQNSQATASVSSTMITVTLTPAMVGRQGVTPQDARLALQQLVWTATAAAQAADLPVQFRVSRGGDQSLFGIVPLDRPYTRGEFSPNPCAPLWITSLVEGTDAGHNSFVVSGDAETGDGGTVTWTLRRDGTQVATGDTVVNRDGTATPRITRHTWSFTPPTNGRKGSYEVVVTLHPGAGSGLSEAVTWQDSRRFVIR